MPVGSALCICTGPQVYSRNVVTCSTQTAVKAAPWGVRGCPRGMGPSGQGGTLVTLEVLWLGMHWPGGSVPPGGAGAEAAQVSPAHPFLSDHSISCHSLLPHSALGFSRHIHVARTSEAWVCMLCQEHAGTLGSVVPMHNNCQCVLVQQLHCRPEPPALCRVTLGPGAAVVRGVGARLGSRGCGDTPGWWGAGRMGLGDRYQLPAGCSCGFLPVPGGGCWGAGRAARGATGPHLEQG